MNVGSTFPQALAPLIASVVITALGGYPMLFTVSAIAAPLDALGVNYYSINAVRAVEGPVPLEVGPPPGYPTTAFGWAVAPEGLTEVLYGLRERYGGALPPIWITENGCAYDGIDDQDRIAYLDGHVAAMRVAIAGGVDVRGYLAWSLMDNFEWAEGFSKRFGLVHVDFATQRRTPKSPTPGIAT